MTASAYRFPNRKQLTRLPALASPLLHFNLAEELAQLRGRALWRRGAQRSSKTLAKYPDFHILLVLMKANSRMGTHHVDARISIHAIDSCTSCRRSLGSLVGRIGRTGLRQTPRCRGHRGECLLNQHLLAGRHEGRTACVETEYFMMLLDTR